MEEALVEVVARRQRLVQVLETTDDPDGTLAADVGARLGELVATEQTRRELLTHPPDRTSCGRRHARAR